MNRIYLIGYMGSGKSTLGKRLSARLNYEFIDLDHLIEIRTGKSIPNLFLHFGEDIFREVESSALHSAMQKEDVVIATGGGTPCFHDNMEQMNLSGHTIFLDVDVPTLLQRINRDDTERPLVDDRANDLEDYVTSHLRDRLPFYEGAKFTIDGGKETDEMIELILSALQPLVSIKSS